MIFFMNRYMLLAIINFGAVGLLYATYEQVQREGIIQLPNYVGPLIGWVSAFVMALTVVLLFVGAIRKG